MPSGGSVEGSTAGSVDGSVDGSVVSIIGVDESIKAIIELIDSRAKTPLSSYDRVFDYALKNK